MLYSIGKLCKANKFGLVCILKERLILKRLKVSNNVIRRLPRYLRKLDELTNNGISRISSFELGQQLGLTPSQIRQDFSCFGEFGQQGYGYNVPALRAQISTILGSDRGFNAILIGVGNIGRALMDNFCFAEWGFKLECAFDIKPELIGTEFNGVPIYSMDNLVSYLQETHVDVAVLTVPKEVAVAVTNTLTENGVEAIWNFTNVELTEPNSPILVENVHFSDSLLSLSYFISERKDERAARAARSEKQ
jgi:redox-sensing transcriptional repressor